MKASVIKIFLFFICLFIFLLGSQTFTPGQPVNPNPSATPVDCSKWASSKGYDCYRSSSCTTADSKKCYGCPSLKNAEKKYVECGECDSSIKCCGAKCPVCIEECSKCSNPNCGGGTCPEGKHCENSGPGFQFCFCKDNAPSTPTPTPCCPPCGDKGTLCAKDNKTLWDCTTNADGSCPPKTSKDCGTLGCADPEPKCDAFCVTPTPTPGPCPNNITFCNNCPAPLCQGGPCPADKVGLGKTCSLITAGDKTYCACQTSTKTTSLTETAPETEATQPPESYTLTAPNPPEAETTFTPEGTIWARTAPDQKCGKTQPPVCGGTCDDPDKVCLPKFSKKKNKMVCKCKYPDAQDEEDEESDDIE